MRFYATILPLTVFSAAVSAHAMLPTPTEVNSTDTGEISYTANPNANPNAATLPINVDVAGRVVTVKPQSTPIDNPLIKNSTQDTTQAIVVAPPTMSALPPPATKSQALNMPAVSTPVSFGTVAPDITFVSQSPVQAPVQFSDSLPTPNSAANQPQSWMQSSEGIVRVINAFIIQNIGGQETLIPINVGANVKSGDILEYQGLFTNNSGERVRSMDITLSIDNGLELIGGISPKTAQASLDNSRFVRMPIRANIDGQIQELPLSQYKALKWTVEEIGLGATAVVKYRAKVK